MRKIFIFNIVFIILSILSTNAQTPTFEWVKKDVGGYALTTDEKGNNYHFGNVRSTRENNPLVKMDPLGNIVWEKLLDKSLYCRSISVDYLGNVYYAGSFHHLTNFDPQGNGFSLTPEGLYDIFILKLDSLGKFNWAKNLGGKLTDFCYSVAVSAIGEVATTGLFTFSGDFDPGINIRSLPYGSNYPNCYDGFFNDDGSMNGSLYDISDPIFNWETPEANYDIFNSDAFLSVLNTDGEYHQPPVGVFGGKEDIGRSVFFDNDENLYMLGLFDGTATIRLGDFDNELVGSDGRNLFLSKWNKSAHGYQHHAWTKIISGVWGEPEYGSSYGNTSPADEIVVDNSGSIYIVGEFSNKVDFNPGTDTCFLTPKGDKDGFILKLNSDGEFIWVKQFGGNSLDKCHDIDVDGEGNIFVTGSFTDSVDFDPNQGSYILTSDGDTDNFILKLNEFGQFGWAIKYNIPGQNLSLKTDLFHNIYISGFFDNTTDFDPSDKEYILSPSGAESHFVLKLQDVEIDDYVPADIKLSNSTINETSEIGTEIGIFSTIDNDTSFVYSFVIGDGNSDNVSFKLDGNKLITNAVFDFESKSSYLVRIQSADPKGNFISKNFVVKVLNENEFYFSCPPDLSLDCTNEIPEPYTNLDNFISDGGQVSSECGLDQSTFKLADAIEIITQSLKTITRTYEITDSCGNVAKGVQELEVTNNNNLEIQGYGWGYDSYIKGVAEELSWMRMPLSTSHVNVSLEQLEEMEMYYGITLDYNCEIKNISYSDLLVSLCPLIIERTFVVTDSFNRSTTKTMSISNGDWGFSYVDPFLSYNNEPVFGGCSLDEIESFTSLPYSPTNTNINSSQFWDLHNKNTILNQNMYSADFKQFYYSDSLTDEISHQTISRKFTAIDYCDDTFSKTQIILLDDVESPELTCPENIEVSYPEDIPEPYNSVTEIVNAGGIVNDNVGVEKNTFQLIGESIDSTQNAFYIFRTYYIEDKCNNDAICLQKIKILNTTTLVDNYNESNETKLSIKPNPNKGEFSLRIENGKAGNYKVQIINELGQVQVEKEITLTSNPFEAEFNISHLSKGNYYIRLYDDKLMYTEKIILK